MDEAVNEIRAALLEESERHERDDHDGEPCLEHRVGLLAFLAHSLGLSAEHLPLLAAILDAYDITHDTTHRWHNGGNGNAL